MGRAQVTISDWIPVTSQDRDAVRRQLQRILDNHLFHNSRRYPNLLQFIVEQTLDGKSNDLKERVLGIEVFGRDPHYDTNLDPIVRVTAGEIRKRIAQYYHEPGHEAELRIDLDPGSYVPRFHLPNGILPSGTSVVSSASDSIVGSLARASSRKHRLYLALALACALVALSGLVILSRPWSRRSALDQFWAPVLDSSGPVLFSIGEPLGNDSDKTAGPATNPPETVSEHIRRVDHIVLPDATAFLNLSRFIGRGGRPYHLQGTTSTTLTDLRQGPSILISAFDNAWTLRVTDPLRFHFVHACDSNVYAIEDRENSGQQWAIDFGKPYSTLAEDYALVARFLDPTTGQLLVIAAGIGSNGTISAGEFLTEKKFLEQVSDQAPRDWRLKNMEAVIATQVIEGKSGPPRVAAVHFW
jgi:hypothetical protein